MSNKTEIDVELLRDLVFAAGYVGTFYCSLVRGETADVHPDWNAVEFLAGEARSTEERGRVVLEAAEQLREAGTCLECGGSGRGIPSLAEPDGAANDCGKCR